MSPIAISASSTLALPAATFRPHGHKHGAPVAPEASIGGAGSSVGQLPVGAATNLYSHLLRALRQTVGAQQAAAANAAPTTPAPTTSATSETGANGSPNSASSNLQLSFDHIVNNLNAGGAISALAATSTASNPSSAAALQSLLNNLLQHVQDTGAHPPNALGASVNAKV